MSEHVVRKCDECGAVHGEVNNWWCVIGEPTEPQFLTFKSADEHAATARMDQRILFRLDYCSHKCVVTTFNRWLDTGDVRVQQRDLERMEDEASAMDEASIQ